MSNAIQRLGSGVAAKWCRVMHPDPMWPVSGMYRCPRCLRQFPVPWEQRTPVRAVPGPGRYPDPAPLLNRIDETVERVHA